MKEWFEMSEGRVVRKEVHIPPRATKPHIWKRSAWYCGSPEMPWCASTSPVYAYEGWTKAISTRSSYYVR